MKKFISIMAVVTFLALSFAVQAATYTNYPASVGTSGGLPAIYSGNTYLLTSTYDQTKAGVTTLGTNDVVLMIPIPANTFVLGAGIALLTPASAASGAAITLGDSASATGYLNTTYVTNGANTSAWSTFAAVTASGTNPASITVTGFTAGKLYTSADYIKLTSTAIPAGAVIEVKALAIPVRP